MYDTQEGQATWKLISLDRVADDVLGKTVAAASHGDSHAVGVVLEDVVGYVRVERLHQRKPSVTVVVDIVACRASEGGCRRVRTTRLVRLNELAGI